jgi:hypothetical protein
MLLQQRKEAAAAVEHELRIILCILATLHDVPHFQDILIFSAALLMYRLYSIELVPVW